MLKRFAQSQVSNVDMFPSHANEPSHYFRVDVPNIPNAISTSTYGSIVVTPPEGISYRAVNWAVVDSEGISSRDNIVIPEDLHQALNSTSWHDNGYFGTNVKVAVFDVEW